MEDMFKGTGFTSLYFNQEPQAALKNKMGNFDGAYLQKSCTQAQGKDDEAVTIASISRQIERKIQARSNTAPLSGFNIALAKDNSITSVRTQEAAEDGDASLLGGASLSLDPAGDDISLLGDKANLTGGDIYPLRDASVEDSITTGHTSVSKVKQAKSLLTQELNSTLKNEI